MTSSHPNPISCQFVEQLFNHPTFSLKLANRMQSSLQQKTVEPLEHYGQKQLSELIEEITALLNQGKEKYIENNVSILREEVSTLYQEIDKVRDTVTFQVSKQECIGRQYSQDLNLEDELLFDLPSIKRTIHSLQEKVKEFSLNSTVLLDPSQNREREEAFQGRIGSVINQLQQSFAVKHEIFQQVFNKRMQKQQKTINNILQTLNDLNGSGRTERTEATLSNSKSATKLKTFFGFKL